RHAVDLVDAHQRLVLLALLGPAHGADDLVAPAELRPAHLGQGDVHVLLSGQVAARAEEAVALRQDVEDSGADLEVAGVLVLGLPPGTFHALRPIPRTLRAVSRTLRAVPAALTAAAAASPVPLAAPVAL